MKKSINYLKHTFFKMFNLYLNRSLDLTSNSANKNELNDTTNKATIQNQKLRYSTS